MLTKYDCMYTFMHRVDPSWLSEDTILKALKIVYSVCITQCILQMQVFCIFIKQMVMSI